MTKQKLNKRQTFNMKYFIFHVATRYDAYEWTQRWLVQADNESIAQKLAEKEDYTHDNGVEDQEVDLVEEIPKKHYELLKDNYYLPSIN